MKLVDIFPDTFQRRNFTCGPAAVNGILDFYGDNRWNEIKLALTLDSSPKTGTQPKAIVEFLKSLGYPVKFGRINIDQLIDYSKKCIPTIILYQAWPEKTNVDLSKTWYNGHYSVVIGYNDHEGLVLEDPWIYGSRVIMPVSELEATWHDSTTGNTFQNFGIVVMPKSDNLLNAPVVKLVKAPD